MHKIAFLGDRRSLLMYRPSGFGLFMPESEAEVRQLIGKLVDEGYAVIFVTERVYRMARQVIESYDSVFLPAVIVLPGYGEDGEEGLRRMNALAENAIGLKM